jgi:formylglycine-generating enzyme required for sulfatase activity
MPYDGRESQCASNDRGGLRVLRGGGWFDDGRGLRSAIRNAFAPGDRGGGIGFRLARGQIVVQPESKPEAR